VGRGVAAVPHRAAVVPAVAVAPVVAVALQVLLLVEALQLTMVEDKPRQAQASHLGLEAEDIMAVALRRHIPLVDDHHWGLLLYS